MLFAEIDWASLVEKGVTSALMAMAFGYALWKVGMKLLDSHFELVKKANDNLDKVNDNAARIVVQLGTVAGKLDGISDKISEWPSDLKKELEQLCQAKCPEGFTPEQWERTQERLRRVKKD